MKKPRLKRTLSFLYVIIFIALAFLFFTNDFGLLDLRKTSVVIGIALDIEDDEVVLTAQLAVPQPAENGENTKFNVVTGRGITVADALNEVNVKTGFYPKLVFCKLILLGESCFKKDVKELFEYFYRNEYTGLALNVAACEGQAAELIGQQFPCGNSATDVIDKLLSSEAKASGNVAAVTLKDVGEKTFSLSAATYMPYFENGILKESGGEESGGGGQSQGGGQQCEESELVCNKCALFSNGYFKGILPVEQTMALNLLFQDVRHVFFESGEDENAKVLGMRNCKGGVDLDLKNGAPVINFKFKAKVKIQDSREGYSPDKVGEAQIEEEDLKRGQNRICKLFEELYTSARNLDCDFFGLKDKLYKKFNDKYSQYEDSLLKSATVTCEVTLKSAS